MHDIQACLRCGGELEHGSIIGQQFYLNWLPEGEDAGITMHGDEHLARGSIGRGPRLESARCASCGLGYFQGSDLKD